MLCSPFVNNGPVLWLLSRWVLLSRKKISLFYLLRWEMASGPSFINLRNTLYKKKIKEILDDLVFVIFWLSFLSNMLIKWHKRVHHEKDFHPTLKAYSTVLYSKNNSHYNFLIYSFRKSSLYYTDICIYSPL